MRVLACGDIHTKVWILDSIEKLIADYDKVVFVGDYADDWAATPQDTIKTWRFLFDLQVKYKGKVEVVAGNHDYIYVNKTPTISSGYNRITQLLIDEERNKDLRSWIKDLPIIETIDSVAYSHAGISQGWHEGYKVENLWDSNSPLWVRPPYTIYKDTPQVFGHTPVETCLEIQENIWCIDTHSIKPNGQNIGDNTVLEITNGLKFNKIKLEK